MPTDLPARTAAPSTVPARFVVEEHGPRSFWVYDTETCLSSNQRFTHAAAQKDADARNLAILVALVRTAALTEAADAVEALRLAPGSADYQVGYFDARTHAGERLRVLATTVPTSQES